MPSLIPSTRLRPRLLMALACILLLPLPVAAQPVTHRIEASVQYGSYSYAEPGWSTRRDISAGHGDGQLRWTRRQRLAVSRVAIVTHIDVGGARGRQDVATISTKSDELLASGPSEHWSVFGRAQLGWDWQYVGVRLGASVGRYASDDRTTARDSVAAGAHQETRLLPAGSLRLGPRYLHFRAAFGDGTWHLGSMAGSVGLGFGDRARHVTEPGYLRAFVGLGGDAQGPNSPIFFFGIRRQFEPIELGLLLRATEGGRAGGLWIGLPL